MRTPASAAAENTVKVAVRISRSFTGAYTETKGCAMRVITWAYALLEGPVPKQLNQRTMYAFVSEANTSQSLLAQTAKLSMAYHMNIWDMDTHTHTHTHTLAAVALCAPDGLQSPSSTVAHVLYSQGR
eukprot:1158489-Pelagomonas_calceolata.AAC.5